VHTQPTIILKTRRLPNQHQLQHHLNLPGETRVLTTSIALDLNRGFFDVAMAYGVMLMVIVIALALTVNLIERIKDECGEIRKFIWWRGLFGG